MAFQSLAGNKMRALLTMLGIIIGVGSVITMTAIGQGAAEVVANQINSMGSNMLQIDPGPSNFGGVSSGAGGSIRLSDKDAEALKQSPYLTAIATSVDTRAQVVAGNLNWLTRITGTTPDILPIRNYSVDRGSMFTDADARIGRKVCLLGKTVWVSLFGANGDPVGQTVQELRAVSVGHHADANRLHAPILSTEPGFTFCALTREGGELLRLRIGPRGCRGEAGPRRGCRGHQARPPRLQEGFGRWWAR